MSKSGRSMKGKKHKGQSFNLEAQSLIKAMEGKPVTRHTVLSSIAEVIKKYEDDISSNVVDSYLSSRREMTLALANAGASAVKEAKRDLNDPEKVFVDPFTKKALLNDAIYLGHVSFVNEQGIMLAKDLQYKSFVRKHDGIFKYVEDDLYVDFLFQDIQTAKHYYENLNVVENGDNEIPEKIRKVQSYVNDKLKYLMDDFGFDSQYYLNLASQEEQFLTRYDTSFTMIPFMSKTDMPQESYNRIWQEDFLNIHENANQIPFQVIGNNVCPVIGYFLTTEQLQRIYKSYLPEHPFYAMYMKHVLWVLSHLSENMKSLCRYNTKIVHPTLPPPYITIKKRTTTVTVYTARHQISTLTTIYKAKLDMNWTCSPESWCNIDFMMAAVLTQLELTPHKPYAKNFKTYQFQKVQYLELEIKVVTHAIKNLTNTPNNFLGRLKQMNDMKKVMAQKTSVKGRYVGTSPDLLQPNCEVVFVTTNKGDFKEHDENNIPFQVVYIPPGDNRKPPMPQEYMYRYTDWVNTSKMVGMLIGEGLPIQVTLKNANHSMFGHNFSHLPSEVVTMGFCKAVEEMVSNLTKPRGDSINHFCQEEVTEISLTWAESASKNFSHQNKKVDKYDHDQYHSASICNRHMNFLVIGNNNQSPYGVQRVKYVFLALPQGLISSKSFCPGWDRVSDKDYQEAMKPIYAFPSQVVKKLKYIVEPESDEQGELPIDKEININALGNDMQENTFQNINIDKALSFDCFSNKILTLEEVLAAASEPSIFDEEVYM
jgi:hypothetical protein